MVVALAPRCLELCVAGNPPDVIPFASATRNLQKHTHRYKHKHIPAPLITLIVPFILT